VKRRHEVPQFGLDVAAQLLGATPSFNLQECLGSLDVNRPSLCTECIIMSGWKFTALLLLTLQASNASALTRSDCEKDYETCQQDRPVT
jgi:hypothetical protein